MSADHSGKLLRIAALLLLFVALLGVRRPDAVTRAQFWAEDGMEWYARAYNAPAWAALTKSYGGYLQTFPRLAGLASQVVDLAHAPLLLNVLAILIQALVPLFLLSSRFDDVIPGVGRRLAVALLLVAAPNLMEVHANITNSHVHLAMLAFLVVLARPSPSGWWRTFDVTVLLVSGFSGPFCILLLPAAALWWLHDRSRWSLVRLVLLGAATAAQASVLLQRATVSRGGLAPVVAGASPVSLLDIIGGQVFVGGLTGIWTYADLHAGAFRDHPWLPWVAALLGVALVARAFVVTSSFALRTFLLFAACHLAAAMRSPIVFGDRSKWELLTTPGAGQRYYYFAILAFLATLVWMAAADRKRAMRVVAVALLAVALLVGVRQDWRMPPFRDLAFAEQVARFRNARARERVEFQIMPEGWTMVLVKH